MSLASEDIQQDCKEWAAETACTYVAGLLTNQSAPDVELDQPGWHELVRRSVHSELLNCKAHKLTSREASRIAAQEYGRDLHGAAAVKFTSKHLADGAVSKMNLGIAAAHALYQLVFCNGNPTQVISSTLLTQVSRKLGSYIGPWIIKLATKFIRSHMSSAFATTAAAFFRSWIPNMVLCVTANVPCMKWIYALAARVPVLKSIYGAAAMQYMAKIGGKLVGGMVLEWIATSLKSLWEWKRGRIDGRQLAKELVKNAVDATCTGVGATIGGVVGSCILPGWGTGIGSVVGGLVGSCAASLIKRIPPHYVLIIADTIWRFRWR